ncbi:NADPH dehydrogenase [Fusarium heterosporum]|uniref:NADPH dehydrogenase n=1 Tax=Fusarium heterosporum TaxID=42747 RepID=A0A8H5U210_FUSHE|nr:NADPH dehydrogenase [Fusarium heterosporum]
MTLGGMPIFRYACHCDKCQAMLFFVGGLGHLSSQASIFDLSSANLQENARLVMLEATAVQAQGRITAEDSGIELDSHVEWLRNNEPFAPGYPTPRAVTLDEIKQFKKDFLSGVRRAVDAGFDVIDFHFAHDYLISSFLSPATNKCTDKYGGSFENKVRLALEIIEEARAIIPDHMPSFARISATDWLNNNPEYEGENWTLDQSIRLAHLLAERGVDVLDVSSGGVHKMPKVAAGPGYQSPFSKAIKKSVGDKMLVSTVGSIKTGTLADEIIQGDDDDTPLDLVAAGRMFQKNPGPV